MTHSETPRWDSCPLCRSDERSTLADHGSLAFVRCRCGLVYKSYGESIFAEQTWNERYNKRQARRVRKARWQIQDVLNHVEPGPLLDVGCSLGYALQAATEMGLDAKGLDLNEALIGPCRDRGFDVHVGDVAGTYPFPDASFQIVLLKHVFEHTPNPRAALRELHRVVKPGGAIFIAVPNVDYFKARLAPKSYYYFSPESGGRYHFVYYTANHLRRLVDDEGFRTVRIHPHLWHRRVDWRTHLTDLCLLPYRALDGRFRNAIGLLKEFWLIAVRQPD